MTHNGSNCFHAFLDFFRGKTKVRLISEISEFLYLALGQIRKPLNHGKFLLTFKNDLKFMSNYDSQL